MIILQFFKKIVLYTILSKLIRKLKEFDLGQA